MPEIIVSLTTVPSRVNFIGKVLDSIDRQTITPSRVELNVPRHYRKRDFGTIDHKKIPSGFNVFECEDYGPATKVLPTAMRYKGTDAIIIYCDDDRLYEKNWINRLVSSANKWPSSVICEDITSAAAFEFRYLNPKKDAKYRVKRLLSLGLYKPERAKSGAKDAIAEGFGGVLVRPHFFNEHIFSVPEEVWAVDDVWLSANYAANNILLRTTKRRDDERSTPLIVEGEELGLRGDALQFAVVNGRGRHEINYRAVVYARETLDVWR